MFELTPFGRRNHDLFRSFQDFENSFFGDDFLNVNSFRTDIKDKGDKYILEADLPGFEKEDIKIDIDNDYLTISAEHNECTDEKDKEGNYIRRERSFGSFSRSFNIANVKTDAIEASYKHGVLKLTMPKKESTVPTSRRLEIK